MLLSRRDHRVTLKVLTINIWNRQGPWPARRILLRQAFERLAPDVIGLQEVIHGEVDSQAQLLSAGLGYSYAFGEAIARGDGSAYGNAVLSRHPIACQQVFPLPGAEDDEPRSVLLAEIELPAGRLPVLVTHLAYRAEHGFVRERQAAALADILDAHVPKDSLPAVVMGDFNAGPDATEIRFLLGLHALDGRSTYLADCYGETGEPPGFTFDGIRPDGTGRGKPLAAEVVMTELTDGVAASDHYGVLATIRM
jgi:endonuclease/exonuclease/phosphatase family metal-dependent hydrolase